MSRESVMRRGRSFARAGFVDSCRITRLTGETVDPNTGAVIPLYATLYDNQVCRMQTRGYWGERKDIGEAGIVQWTMEIQLPIEVVGLRINDYIEILSSAYDPELVGHRMLLRDLNFKTEATARRVLVTEVTG